MKRDVMWRKRSQDMRNVRCICDGEMDISNGQLHTWVGGVNPGVVSMTTMGVDEITEERT